MATHQQFKRACGHPQGRALIGSNQHHGDLQPEVEEPLSHFWMVEAEVAYEYGSLPDRYRICSNKRPTLYPDEHFSQNRELML